MAGARADQDRARFGLRRPCSIQARIQWLVVACILPLWLLSVFIAERSHRHVEQDLIDSGVQAARGLSQAIEAELSNHVVSLQALATSPLIDDGDYARLYRSAQEVGRLHGAFNLFVVRPDMQVSMTLDRPFGTPPPRLPVDRLPEVIATQRPAVSDLFVGRIVPEPFLSAAVPVLREGKAIARLEMVFSPQRFADLLVRSGLPGDWSAAVLDRGRG